MMKSLRKPSYTDAQLDAILRDTPTRANAEKHARKLKNKHTPRAIELIYQRAMSVTGFIGREGPDDHAFVLQIQRAKNVLAG